MWLLPLFHCISFDSVATRPTSPHIRTPHFITWFTAHHPSLRACTYSSYFNCTRKLEMHANSHANPGFTMNVTNSTLPPLVLLLLASPRFTSLHLFHFASYRFTLHYFALQCLALRFPFHYSASLYLSFQLFIRPFCDSDLLVISHGMVLHWFAFICLCCLCPPLLCFAPLCLAIPFVAVLGFAFLCVALLCVALLSVALLQVMLS